MMANDETLDVHTEMVELCSFLNAVDALCCGHASDEAGLTYADLHSLLRPVREKAAWVRDALEQGG